MILLSDTSVFGLSQPLSLSRIKSGLQIKQTYIRIKNLEGGCYEEGNLSDAHCNNIGLCKG